MEAAPDNTVQKKESTIRYWLKSGLRYILTVGIIGIVAALIITVTHQYTAPVISANEYNRLMETLAQMVPAAEEFDTVPADGQDVYVGLKEGKVVGVILPVQSRGFYGDYVEMLVLVGPVGDIKDVVILRHRETPGIGTKIEEPSFLAQFSDQGKVLLKDVEVDLESFLAASVDTISGATISAEAVINGVSLALEVYAGVPHALDSIDK